MKGAGGCFLELPGLDEIEQHPASDVQGTVVGVVKRFCIALKGGEKLVFELGLRDIGQLKGGENALVEEGKDNRRVGREEQLVEPLIPSQEWENLLAGAGVSFPAETFHLIRLVEIHLFPVEGCLLADEPGQKPGGCWGFGRRFGHSKKGLCRIWHATSGLNFRIQRRKKRQPAQE